MENGLRISKDGFVLELEEKQYRISNQYGVQEKGKAKPQYAEKLLEDFVESHSLTATFPSLQVGRVVVDRKTNRYLQLIGKQDRDGKWRVQVYDDGLVYKEEIIPDGQDLGWRWYDVLDWMRGRFQIATGFCAYVYRSTDLGDCSNGGISSHQHRLSILTMEGPYEIGSILECVKAEQKQIGKDTYCFVRPICYPKRVFSMGGNFLYTADSRFREVTGTRYPVPIHDRYEG